MQNIPFPLTRHPELPFFLGSTEDVDMEFLDEATMVLLIPYDVDIGPSTRHSIHISVPQSQRIQKYEIYRHELDIGAVLYHTAFASHGKAAW